MSYRRDQFFTVPLESLSPEFHADKEYGGVCYGIYHNDCGGAIVVSSSGRVVCTSCHAGWEVVFTTQKVQLEWNKRLAHASEKASLSDGHDTAG